MDVEVKSAAHELPKRLARTVSSFANTHGGTIILGLDESTGFTLVDGFKAEDMAIHSPRFAEITSHRASLPTLTSSISRMARSLSAQFQHSPHESSPATLTHRGNTTAATHARTAEIGTSSRTRLTVLKKTGSSQSGTWRSFPMQLLRI
ncbi:MAG: ATP-binding protein [Corynebacterium glucuronolyticum]|nr:ATP-binding protein [Corynebacterium glucuronolyticum]